MTITIVAIDGIGKQTDLYVDLLRTCQSVVPQSVARLLTSDAEVQAADVDCVTIEPLDYFAYSRFCVEDLVRYVDTEHCLMVQLDGFVVNPSLWSDEFLKHDYVGAPWRSKRGRAVTPGLEVGNGGFSLRSRRFLEASSELSWSKDWKGVEVPSKYHGNEDYFLSVICREQLESRGVRFAPRSVAARFSIQAGDAHGGRHRLGNTYGFHGKKWMHRAAKMAARHGVDYPHMRRIPKPWWKLV